MTCEIGIVGLGVMGSNLALNLAEKGFNVAVFNRTFAKTEHFLASQPENMRQHLKGFPTLNDFVQSLQKPRKILVLVPAGAATESAITELKALLDKNDIIVDTGNAHFKDQGRRAEELEAVGLRFLAMGISGGEEGARKGPAFFPGGTLSVWNDIKRFIEAAAARADDGRPCVTMNGTKGAGSCVKMYHNAGEYAILQIWAEVIDLLLLGGLTHEEVVAVLREWSRRGTLKSYMLDISIEVLQAKESDGTLLIHKVSDKVGSKGTGLWSVQEALEVGCPAPSLAMAVIARQMSMARTERGQIFRQGLCKAPETNPFLKEQPSLVESLYHATFLSIVASYAQMFQCLRAHDVVHGFGLNLPATIATFRSGCILQGQLLKPMTEAFEKDPQLPNLMCAFKKEFEQGLPLYKELVAVASRTAHTPIPVLSASLTYILAMSAETLRYGQVVSLQRDVFGRHGFERLDAPGLHNHQWPALQ